MMFYVSHVVNKIDIINLVKTLYNLRLFFSFLRKVYFNRGFVWFHVFLSGFLQKEFLNKYKLYRLFRRRFLFNKKFVSFKDKLCRVLFFKWIYGLISNYKKIKKHFRKKRKSDRILLKFPQIVIFLSKVNVTSSIIPVVNVVDTSSNIKKGLYLINAANKNYKSILFLLRLFVKERLLLKRLQKVFFKSALNYVL